MPEDPAKNGDRSMVHRCKHDRSDGTPMRIDSETLECVAPDGQQREPCLGINCRLWQQGEVNHFDLDKARADGDNTLPNVGKKETGDKEATLA